MKRLIALIYLSKKEIQSYFYSPVVYLFTLVFLIILGYFFWKNIGIFRVASMREFFSTFQILFIFFIPALGMKSWSEELKAGTDEILLSLSVNFWDVVVAKWIGLMCFALFPLVASLPFALYLSSISNLDWGPVLGSYFGVLCLAGAYGAISTWVSSLTKNQLISLISSTLIIGTFHVLGIIPASGILKDVTKYSFATRFISFSKGVIDLSDVLFFISITVLCLFFTYLSLVKQRYAKQ